MDIGAKIKTLRKELKMTQKDFAKACNISASYLSELERGQKRPTFDIIHKISIATNVKISDFAEESNGTPLTPELKEIVETLRDFKPEQIKLLKDFLASLKI